MKKSIVTFTALMFLFLGLNNAFSQKKSYLGPVNPSSNDNYYVKQTSTTTEDVCFLGPIGPDGNVNY